MSGHAPTRHALPKDPGAVHAVSVVARIESGPQAWDRGVRRHEPAGEQRPLGAEAVGAAFWKARSGVAHPERYDQYGVVSGEFMLVSLSQSRPFDL